MLTSKPITPALTASQTASEPTTQRGWLGWTGHGMLETGLIVLGLLINFEFVAHIVGGDGVTRYRSLTSLLTRGLLDNSKYSLIGPLFSAPLWYLGLVWNGSSWWVARFNFFLFAIGLLAMYWLLKTRMDRRLLRAFLLILVAASLFPNALEYYYAEVFTAIFVALGTLALVCGSSIRGRIMGWVAVVIGVANTPAALVGMAVMVLARIVQQRRMRYALALFAAAGVIALENTIRRGGPLNTGYESGFGNPFFFGLVGILFSYGKGLIFFTPGLFLPVKKRLQGLPNAAGQSLYTIYLLWMAFVIAMVLLYSHWWAWFGGYSWGPRFFLFASLPASLVLAVRLRYPGEHLVGNLLTLLAFALSSWVAVTGMVFEMGGLFACTQGYDQLIGLCVYTPQYSELWRAFVVPLPFGKHQAVIAGYCGLIFVYLAWPLLRAVAAQVRALWHDLTNAQGMRWLWRFRF